jgi:hypothetical protein
MNKQLILTGVGSRETPHESLERISEISRKFSLLGLTLRSGGARGADEEFEDNWLSTKEIYLPKEGFRGRKGVVPVITKDHMRLAALVHPVWHKCSEEDRVFHCRNVCQVLGEQLDTPSDLLVCWTWNGRPVGGTGTAIRLARAYDIPVYNIYFEQDLRKLWDYYRELKYKESTK